MGGGAVVDGADAVSAKVVVVVVIGVIGIVDNDDDVVAQHPIEAAPQSTPKHSLTR